jgi:outer membrane protein OmpA-like peptidoglycan-associated protein
VGKPDANLKLSQARAEAVKAALAKEYGIAEGQLTAKGYGDTKPSTDNKTAEGRANNRRVELVKS